MIRVRAQAMLRSGEGDRLISQLLGIALVLAVISNGASAYLKRTGVLDREAYLAYWAVHCGDVEQNRPFRAAEPRCCEEVLPDSIRAVRSARQIAVERRYASHVFTVSGAEFLMKLVKDVLMACFIAVSLYMNARRRPMFPALREAWPVQLLLAYALVAAVFAWNAHGALVAASGFRFLFILVIALTGSRCAPQLGRLAAYVGALLVFEILLLPAEIYWGIHLHGHLGPFALAKRASATLVLPNSLGIFAVVALAFYYSFSQARQHFSVLVLAALLLVVASGSATGLLGMLLVLAGVLFAHSSGASKRLHALSAVLAALALFLALPVLTGRSELYSSIFGVGGRIEILSAVLSEQGFLDTLFGNGLGLGTNTALNLAGLVDAGSYGGVPGLVGHGPDSTVTALVIQLGVVGTAAFYALLLRALFRDRTARIFYATVILGSVTLNVTELFPVNFLLGLALARSMSREREK